jgi:hypothetical protein
MDKKQQLLKVFVYHGYGSEKCLKRMHASILKKWQAVGVHDVLLVSDPKQAVVLYEVLQTAEKKRTLRRIGITRAHHATVTH